MVGAFNIESGAGVELTEADLHLLEALVNHISLAIGRAQIYAAKRAGRNRVIGFRA